MQRGAVVCVFAVLGEAAAVAVAVAVGGRDEEALAVGMKRDGVAVGEFGLDVKRLCGVGPHQQDKAAPGRAGGDGEQVEQRYAAVERLMNGRDRLGAWRMP